MMKKSVLMLCLAFVSIQLSAKTLLDRTWNFASSADVLLTVKDTLSVGIHFPSGIPDDRLLGYCRFHITVTDSNAGAPIAGKSFVYRIQNDCGFNAFDHLLTLELNYSTGFSANRTKNPKNCRMYMDPYPVSKIHQWFAVDTSYCDVDTVLGVMRVVYSHKKPVMAIMPGALGKVTIASTGYPFDYGLFSTDTNSRVRFMTRNQESNLKYPCSGQAFFLNGKWAGPITFAINQGSRFKTGCIVLRPDGNKAGEKAKCFIMIK